MKKYIVFDCYQTLIYKKNLAKTTQDFSRKILKKKISLDYIKHSYKIIYNRYKFKHTYCTTPEKLKKFYIEYNKELFAIIGISITSHEALQLNKFLNKVKWACYSETKTALNNLKRRKIPLGLIANWTKTLNEVLKKVNLDHYFDFVHSSHDLKINKPNPEIFTKALNNVIKKFDNIYYVGDDYELDIIPSKKAGLIPILIDRNNQYPSSVDCIRIKKLTDLEKFI